jgi:hypothetical protein
MYIVRLSLGTGKSFLCIYLHCLFLNLFEISSSVLREKTSNGTTYSLARESILNFSNNSLQETLECQAVVLKHLELTRGN